ncbi:hypothetical protein BVY03_05885 [bacterium K02(2017)]|nr:hypothetical protein BVY03_05885 [bacterium K02(2017)]
MLFKCVYCCQSQNQPFNDEHVVPRAFGKFLYEGHELIINDRICNKCNQDLSWCEGELAYGGMEAMLRRKIGIKGRNTGRKKANPFYDNKFSKKPIKMTGIREEFTTPNLWELDPKTGNAVELNHVAFQHPETNETKLIPTDKEMTRSSLLETMKENGWVDKHPFEIFTSDEDKSWIIELFGKDADKIEWVDNSGLKPVGKVNVESEMVITAKHHRAIAKIAFTYLMYFRLCGITGFEDTFSEIRNFIRYGKGKPNDFVRYVKKDILYEAGNGMSLVDYGHIITCDVSKKCVLAQIQLFTGREHGHGTYEINIGKYPFKIIASEVLGHWFRITSKVTDKEDAGEVISIQAPKYIQPPSQYYKHQSFIKPVRMRKF